MKHTYTVTDKANHQVEGVKSTEKGYKTSFFQIMWQVLEWFSLTQDHSSGHRLPTYRIWGWFKGPSVSWLRHTSTAFRQPPETLLLGLTQVHVYLVAAAFLGKEALSLRPPHAADGRRHRGNRDNGLSSPPEAGLRPLLPLRLSQSLKSQRGSGIHSFSWFPTSVLGAATFHSALHSQISSFRGFHGLCPTFHPTPHTNTFLHLFTIKTLTYLI